MGDNNRRRPPANRPVSGKPASGRPVSGGTSNTRASSARPASGKNAYGRTTSGKQAQRAGIKKTAKSKSVKNKPKRVNFTLSIVVFLLLTVIVAYLLKEAMDLFDRTDIPSVAVQIGSIDLPVVLNGIIVRNERVYSAPSSGTVNYNYNDLDRVKKSSTICGISDAEAVLQITSDIDELNKAILNMQEFRDDMTPFKKDVENVNQQIKDIVDNRVFASLRADFNGLYEAKEAIGQNLNLRNQILLNERRGSLTDLVNERQRAEAELGKNLLNIYAEASGILSYVIDGLESTLTIENINKLTPEQTRMKVDFDRIVVDRSVEAGEQIFKIVEANEWYIAAYIPIDLIFDWKEGDMRTIYLQMRDSYIDLPMSVDSLTAKGTDYYAVLKSTKNMADFMRMRDVQFKVSNSEHRGYKIPTAAIVDKSLLKIPNDYIEKADTNSFSIIKHTEKLDERMSINVLDSDAEYSYVMQEFDRLMLNDSVKHQETGEILALSEIVNVKGVYVINRGYEEFRKITIDPAVPTMGDYVILKPEANTGIKIHDRIRSDAKTVSEQ